MITIRDIIIAPYEIDVDKHNFTLVKVVAYEKEGGTKAKKRKVCGYYNTLRGALNGIANEIVNRNMQKKTNQVLTITEFLDAQEKQQQVLRKWYMRIAPDAQEMLEGLPQVTPKQILANYTTPKIEDDATT